MRSINQYPFHIEDNHWTFADARFIKEHDSKLGMVESQEELFRYLPETDKNSNSKKNLAVQPLIQQAKTYCKCGCGLKIQTQKYTNYIYGHKNKYINNLYILCQCGCKNKLLKYDLYKRSRKFILGHNVMGQNPWIRFKDPYRAKTKLKEKLKGKHNSPKTEFKEGRKSLNKGQIKKEIQKFIEENTNKYLCKCGCEQFIIIRRYHHIIGIPNYIKGHYFKNKVFIISSQIKPMWRKKLSQTMKRLVKEGILHSQFKKGQIPWNKSKKGAYTLTFKNPEERNKKLSEARKNIFKSGKIVNYWKDKKQPIEFTIKRSASRQKIDVSQWNGFITPINERIRRSGIFDQWRQSVYKRDNWICQECYDKSGNGHAVILCAHHIKKFSKYPELRFDINNGITLCTNCHDKTLWKEEQFEGHFQDKLRKIMTILPLITQQKS